MIVDQANMDIELENDPFIEAGIDVPANLPYHHNAHLEQSYKKVLGGKDTPQLTKKLRKINQWSLRGTGVSTAVLCKALEAENSEASDMEVNDDIESNFRSSQRSGRRLSSPILYNRRKSEIQKAQNAEKRIRKKPLLKHKTAHNLFQSSYVPDPQLPNTKPSEAGTKGEKIQPPQNKKTSVSITKNTASLISN